MSSATTSSELVRIGTMLADRTRAEILCALMDGRAHTGRELSRHLGVADSTISAHLSKLLDAGFVAVDAQGRHRYWRLSDPRLAELLEQLGSHPIHLDDPKAPADLVYARTCYDHLAGALAVRIYDGLVEAGHLVVVEGGAELSESGRALLASIGAGDALDGANRPGSRSGSRPVARPCLDWTQRRHHLAGVAGGALLDALFEHGWIRRGNRPRSVEVTERGRRELHDRLPLAADR